ncbi:hypothetical protein JCM10296v2_002924 [Rhodotorula toruloides]
MGRWTVEDNYNFVSKRENSVTDLKKGTRSDNYLATLQSNGRLEWQGDAVLRYLISKKLLKMLEFATAGFLSVRDPQPTRLEPHFLAIACHYGLQDTLKTNPNLKNRAPAMEQKTLANTFEAYLGAVVSASGEDVLADYVDKLLRPEVFRQLGALQEKLNEPLSRWEGEDRHKKRRLDMLVPEMDDLLGDAQGRHSRTNSIAHSWEDVWTQPTGWISTLVGPEGTAVGQAPNKMKSRDEAVGAYLRREFKTGEFKVGDA